jgi:hypothetical protein
LQAENSVTQPGFRFITTGYYLSNLASNQSFYFAGTRDASWSSFTHNIMEKYNDAYFPCTLISHKLYNIYKLLIDIVLFLLQVKPWRHVKTSFVSRFRNAKLLFSQTLWDT